MKELYLNDEFSKAWADSDPFEAVFSLGGEDYRRVKARRTFRFELGGRGFFAKVHSGVGWREIFKDIFQFKKPVLGAENEYRALHRLAEAGVDTMTPCAFGTRGRNPARRVSFLVTEELENTLSLESLFDPKRGERPDFRLKRALLRRLGEMTGAMHRAGVNHRDCYICHFLLDLGTVSLPEPKLYVIDLHRAMINAKAPFRYVVKDVGGLFFSSLDAGLTTHDYLRFALTYSGARSLRELADEAPFWRKVVSNGMRLYSRIHGRKASIPGKLLNFA